LALAHCHGQSNLYQLISAAWWLPAGLLSLSASSEKCLQNLLKLELSFAGSTQLKPEGLILRELLLVLLGQGKQLVFKFKVLLAQRFELSNLKKIID
jgi:hypothetical protein